MKTTLAIVALGLATSAGATTILTTGIGFGAQQVNCFTLNASSKPVEVDAVFFIGVDGLVRPTTTSTCTYPGMVSPGQACQDNLNLGAAGGFVRCVIVTKGNSKSIRGSLFMTDNLGQLLLETR